MCDISIDNPARSALVFEDKDTGQRVGMLLGLFRDRQHEPHTPANDFLFRFIDEAILPPDGPSAW
jgi:hypothetical protein